MVREEVEGEETRLIQVDLTGDERKSAVVALPVEDIITLQREVHGTEW
jgi:hypothetical protein